MIKYLIGIITIAAVVASCGGEDDAALKKGDGKFYSTEIPDAEVLRVGIKQLEDSIMKVSRSNTDQKVTNLLQQACLEKLKLMYRAYPKDKDAALSLQKVYMLYSGMGAAELSAKYADSLIEKYPNYEQGWLALQSNALYYDREVVPRNKEKVRYYLEKLLKDYPNLDPEIIADTKYRLSTIDLTFEELIQKQNPPS